MNSTTKPVSFSIVSENCRNNDNKVTQSFFLTVKHVFATEAFEWAEFAILKQNLKQNEPLVIFNSPPIFYFSILLLNCKLIDIMNMFPFMDTLCDIFIWKELRFSIAL